MTTWTSQQGEPYPQGVTWIEAERAFNFSIYSKHAQRVELLFYGDGDYVNPVHRYTLDYLKNKTHRIWHCRIPRDRIPDARYYAYRISGPRPQDTGGWQWFERCSMREPSYSARRTCTSSRSGSPATMRRLALFGTHSM